MPYYPPAGGGSVSSSGLATNAAAYILSSANANLGNALVLLPGSSTTTHITGSNLYINATTSGGGSGISFQFPSSPGNINIGSSSLIYVYSDGLPANTMVDLYTVPTGKRGLIYATLTTNTGAVTNSIIANIKVSSTYYPVQSHAPQAGRIQVGQISYIAEAGEILAMYVSNAGVSVRARILEYGTDVLLRSYKIVSISSGMNTVFTSSNNYVLGNLTTGIQNDAAQGSTMYFNGLSGSSIVAWYAVKSGQTLPTLNQSVYMLTNTASPSSLSRQTDSTNFVMTSGDYLVFYSNTGASPQIAWVNMVGI